MRKSSSTRCCKISVVPFLRINFEFEIAQMSNPEKLKKKQNIVIKIKNIWSY
jgi:hypothetical protein